MMDTTASLADGSHYYVRIDGIEKSVAISVQNLEQGQYARENQQSQVWLSWVDETTVLVEKDWHTPSTLITEIRNSQSIRVTRIIAREQRMQANVLQCDSRATHKQEYLFT